VPRAPLPPRAADVVAVAVVAVTVADDAALEDDEGLERSISVHAALCS
jgi:hypothetical protein